MPGVACDLYIAGHCLYEEDLNPGLHEQYLCAEVARIVAAYEELVSRADGFTLGNEQAFNVIHKLMDNLPPAGSLCSDYRPAGGCGGCRNCGADSGDASMEIIDCAHALSELCVLRLPMCEGVCKKFRFRTAAAVGDE